MQHSSRFSAVLCLLLALSACSGNGDSEPGAGTAPKGGPGASASPGQSTEAPSSQRAAPFLTREASYFSPTAKPRRVRLDVYPAVRVPEGLFIEVDLTATPGSDPAGDDYFCAGVVCEDFALTSIVDPAALVRYEPLRDGSATGDVLSSEIPFDLDQGVRYRSAVLFPEPDGKPATIDLFLQYGGVVDNLPVTDGKVPEGLLRAGGAPSAKPGTSGTPAEQLRPVRAASGTPFVVRHPLVAKVVGGTVNQAAGTEQGSVSLAADVLFGFDSASLSPESAAAVQQAAQILVDKADPAKPVVVAGHTDSKGSDAINADLSTRRANAVAEALRGQTGALKLEPVGFGATKPVVPNKAPDGSDDPAGRALNRRVELSYTPRPTPPPSPAPAPSPAASSPQAPGAPLASLSAPAVIGSGAGPVPMNATIRSLRRDGQLTVIEVGVTPVGKDAAGVDYFGDRNDRNVGRWRLVVPATGAVYVPAADGDPPVKSEEARVLGTEIRQMNGDVESLITFWTAVLPADLQRVDVDLGQLGVAKDVPVTG